jgi:hypothetical protein
MSRQAPHPHAVSLLAWRTAWISLISVLGVTVVVGLWIAYQGEETRSTLTPDRFDERWQIRSGAATPERLALNPTADSIGVALRPIEPHANSFTLQTRAQFNQPTGAAGLIVQADDADHFVAFLISADGYFRLSAYRNGVWIDRVPWTTWPHIRKDGSSNLLRAECQGETCTFFVNDEWTWQAESIPATTQVGVAATGLDAPSNTAVVFDQFALRSP